MSCHAVKQPSPESSMNWGRELSALARPDPWHFRDLATRVSLRHHSMDFAAATSALDIALWDLIGRLVAKPLVELLGPPKCRNAAVYANIWSESNLVGHRAGRPCRTSYCGRLQGDQASSHAEP